MCHRAYYLVQGNNKGSLAHLEQVDGFNGLLLQAVHHVHHQDGNITQAGPTRPQVGERLMTYIAHEQFCNIRIGSLHLVVCL